MKDWYQNKTEEEFWSDIDFQFDFEIRLSDFINPKKWFKKKINELFRRK